ncbi:MAG: hypothetical protein J0G37_12185 [Afipia sp.]|nr:hypothetical protein [Afipia sp.]
MSSLSVFRRLHDPGSKLNRPVAHAVRAIGDHPKGRAIPSGCKVELFTDERLPPDGRLRCSGTQHPVAGKNFPMVL